MWIITYKIICVYTHIWLYGLQSVLMLINQCLVYHGNNIIGIVSPFNGRWDEKTILNFLRSIWRGRQRKYGVISYMYFNNNILRLIMCYFKSPQCFLQVFIINIIFISKGLKKSQNRWMNLIKNKISFGYINKSKSISI